MIVLVIVKISKIPGNHEESEKMNARLTLRSRFLMRFASWVDLADAPGTIFDGPEYRILL